MQKTNMVFEITRLISIFKVLRIRAWADPSQCHDCLVNASISDIIFVVSFITRIFKLLVLHVADITKAVTAYGVTTSMSLSLQRQVI